MKIATHTAVPMETPLATPRAATARRSLFTSSQTSSQAVQKAPSAFNEILGSLAIVVHKPLTPPSAAAPSANQTPATQAASPAAVTSGGVPAQAIAGFGPVPQPPKLEVCSLGDDRCTQRNTILDQQLAWNQTVAASVQSANSFIGAYKQGGAIDWSKLTPLTQAIVLGKVTGYATYDNTISEQQWNDYQGGRIGPGDFWTPPYTTTGFSLAPPTGVPNGPGFAPVPVTTYTTSGPASSYPLATVNAGAAKTTATTPAATTK